MTCRCIQTMLLIKSTVQRWFNSGRSRVPLVLSVAFVASAISATPMARSAEIEAVRLWRAPDHTRVVLDLSGAADFKTLTLADPDRLVLDLLDTRLNTALSALPLEETPIAGVRAGIRQGTNLRLVFDLTAQVTVSVFFIAAK